MSYSYYIAETLKDYNGTMYKMVRLAVIATEGKIEEKSLPLNLMVTDGVNSINSFITLISGNKKEIHAFFTVDAFTGFSNNSTIKFGYGNDLTQEVQNVNVQSIPSLPSLFSSIPYQIADNAWLASII